MVRSLRRSVIKEPGTVRGRVREYPRWQRACSRGTGPEAVGPVKEAVRQMGPGETWPSRRLDSARPYVPLLIQRKHGDPLCGRDGNIAAINRRDDFRDTDSLNSGGTADSSFPNVQKFGGTRLSRPARWPVYRESVVPLNQVRQPPRHHRPL